MPSVIIIQTGTSRGCLGISIIQSSLVEGSEMINLAINQTTTAANVVNGTTTILITGDGGKSPFM